MQCGGGLGAGTIVMIGLKRFISRELAFILGLKRFISRDLVFSLVGHAGLLLGLLVASAGGVPHIPPQAMTVEIVPSSEAPEIETENVNGTPLESTSSGSELESDSEKGSATAARPVPKFAAPPSLQQAQTRSDTKRRGGQTAEKPQTAALAQPQTQPQTGEPVLPPTESTDQPQPQPRKATNQPNAGEMFAMPLALPGGRLGGGFDAPAANAAKAPHDDLAAFRAKLSSCSHLPEGFSLIDNDVMIVVRISFKRDGTLASKPQLVDASLSPDVALLLQTAIDALEKCQPFAELPADKYRKWKTLEFVVTPFSFSGG